MEMWNCSSYLITDEFLAAGFGKGESATGGTFNVIVPVEQLGEREEDIGERVVENEMASKPPVRDVLRFCLISLN